MRCMGGGAPAAALADRLPGWVTLVRAPNPGPMTLEGTNTWLLRAAGSPTAVAVDPGPLDETHLAALAGHGPFSVVLVTHGHPDHTEAVPRFVALSGATPFFDPPAAPLEVAGVRITTVATPGHTADSVCFLVECGAERVLLTGDTILGRGSTVVAWPDGDLGDYLASLQRLTAFSGIPALPGHGPALADCAEAARAYLAHRRDRLDQVRAALAAGARAPAEVVAVVYADVDRTLWPAAEQTVRAQLAYLNGNRA